MYLEYFGLQEAPFRITPHTDFFFDGAHRGETLEALLYAVTQHEGIVKVTGEVGSGKTMLCRMLLERFPAHVETVYLANPSLSREEILLALVDELKVNLATQRPSAVLRALQEHLITHHAEGKRVVVLVDEAHAMPAETLEEIRLLSNLETSRHKLMQIVLFGQPELDATLSRPDMRQLKERITHNFVLEPLRHADVARYIGFRMHAAGCKGREVFTGRAVKLIARASLGLTRRINILADKSLMAAFAEGVREVGPHHVRRAVRDSDFSAPPRWRWGLVGAGGLVAAILLGLAVQFLQMTGEARAVPNTAPIPAAVASGPAGTQAPAAPGTSSAAQQTREAQSLHVAAEAGPLHTTALSATASGPLEKFGPLTRQRILETRAWLAAVPTDRWFVQLLAASASQARQVEEYLARAAEVADPGSLRAYLAEVDGGQRVGVIYGEYASRQEAFRALSGLPEPLKTYGPYVRSVQQLPR